MFSDSLNELTNEQLKNTNYGRILLLNKFEELISDHKLPKKIKIGIVGGSKNEPEVLLLEKLGYEISLEQAIIQFKLYVKKKISSRFVKIILNKALVDWISIELS